MQQPFANAAQSGGALCDVPKTVAPFFAEKSKTTFRAIVHGSSFQAPRAQPNESINRRFTSCTTFRERSSKLSEQAKAASWCASVGFVIEKRSCNLATIWDAASRLLGSARVSRVGFGVSPKQSFQKSS